MECMYVDIIFSSYSARYVDTTSVKIKSCKFCFLNLNLQYITITHDEFLSGVKIPRTGLIRWHIATERGGKIHPPSGVVSPPAPLAHMLRNHKRSRTTQQSLFCYSENLEEHFLTLNVVYELKIGCSVCESCQNNYLCTFSVVKP